MKLTINVEYLLGKVYSSEYNDPSKVEWPPHPSRLFSAMVAAYHECSLGDDARKALIWLESLNPPSIYVNPPISDNTGSIETFVPVNDSIERGKKKKDGFKLFPKISEEIQIRRLKQDRIFPFFSPESNLVQFIWDNAIGAEEHFSVLKTIASNVTYLGNSMSMVLVTIGDTSYTPTIEPNSNGNLHLRTTGKGRLEHLEEVYSRRLKNSIHQPVIGNVTTYGIIGNSHFDDNGQFHVPVIFRRKSGDDIPLEYALILSSYVRRTILSKYPEPIPSEISGHYPNGEKFKKQHLHIIPLADNGWEFSDGHLLGFALLLPKSVDQRIATTLEDAMIDVTEINMGRVGKWFIEALSLTRSQNIAKSLQFDRYTKKSEVWATVTPMVFGKHPKKSKFGSGKDGGKIFSEVLEMSNLPHVKEVRVSKNSFIRGVPSASGFKLTEKFDNRYVAHVMVRFPEPVIGPVVLGSGRFVGMGLFRPLSRGEIH